MRLLRQQQRQSSEMSSSHKKARRFECPAVSLLDAVLTPRPFCRCTPPLGRSGHGLAGRQGESAAVVPAQAPAEPRRTGVDAN